MQQLPLGITLKPGISFDSFIPGRNTQAIASLQSCISGYENPFIFLWGGNGTGKSHLLQATCHQADLLNLQVAYIPLLQAASFSAEIFEGLEQFDLVCLDDIAQITGQPDWEQALFNLFNRLRDRGARLLVTADRSPIALEVTLPDLASRLSWGLNYRLYPLTEDETIEALIKSATKRGLKLPQEAAHYLLKHCPRDMGSLLEILDQLDQASLAAQRKLTIPFIRSQLESELIAARRLHTQT
ncbi:DnaA regulatory inactivator Hda [Pseudomonadota bacterium]